MGWSQCKENQEGKEKKEKRLESGNQIIDTE
jgi:hypothetical protein